MATEGLSGHHQNEVKKILKFFRTKLDLHLKALESDFEDTRTDRLESEDMYTRDEVAEVMDSLCSAIQSSVRSEFQACINMSALLLRQVFVEADNNDIEMELDTSIIEDRALLERVQRLRLDEITSETMQKVKKADKKVEKLQAKQDEMNEEMEDLRSENRKLRQQLQDAHVHSSEAVASSKSSGRDMEDMRLQLRDQEQRAKDAEQHVMKSKQFQQMKNLLTQKNDQLRDLRKRLYKYEPDMDAVDSDEEERGCK